jgi:hypothetical protein
MQKFWMAVMVAMFLMVAGVGVSHAQFGAQQTVPHTPNVPPGMDKNGDDTTPPASVLERQELARQTDRQKRLISDTDKLLELATQLKADVNKTNKDTLSIEVIKKAEEIEKLAHSVKERMKG